MKSPLLPTVLLILSLLPLPAGELSATRQGPVVFWAHYMLSVPHGNLGTSAQCDGNMLAWPFVTQHAKGVDDYEEDIRQALASGVNGFQLYGAGNSTAVDAFFQAADAVYRETGEVMYLAPLWQTVRADGGDPAAPPQSQEPDAQGIGDDPAQSAAAIAAFARKYRDSRHLLRLGGRQVQFLWLAKLVYVSETASAEYQDLKRRQRTILDEVGRLTGGEVLLLPESVGVDKQVLGRPDLLRKSWDDAELANTPETAWFQDPGWPGCAGWDRAWYPPAARKFQERLARHPEFLWIPGIAAGYDNSGRVGTATYIPYRGVRNLLDSLGLWVREFGYKQIYLSTWNDTQETMVVPSSRNVWGDNAILRFFHGIAEDGRSPFDSARIVASYPFDCLYGDQVEIQVAALPARGGKAELRATVDLLSDGPQATLQGEAAAPRPDQEALVALRWDSTEALGRIDFVQPRVTVEGRDPSSGEWKTLYANLLLPPIRLRHDFIQFPGRYAADLSRIAPGDPLSVRFDASGTLGKAVVQADLPSPVRRLVLSDGAMSLGAFRPAEAAGETPFPWKNLYLKVESSGNEAPAKLRLSVRNGWIRDLYMHHGILATALVPVEKGEASFNGRPVRRYSRVARCDLGPDSEIALGLTGAGAPPPLATTVAELARGPVARTFPVNGHPVNLSLRLTTDASDPLLDFPLPPRGSFQRDLPLDLDGEGERVLYATALLDSGSVAYSPAVALGAAGPAARAPLRIRAVRSGGTFDDFIHAQIWAADSDQPYTPAQVVEADLPRNRVPWFHLDFEEGSGSRLNDRGTGQQPGRAWVDAKGPPRDEHYAIEDSGLFRWLAEGWKGRGFHLGNDAEIWFRAKSQPVGAETISLWAVVGSPSPEGASETASKLGAGPFQMTLTPNGGAVVEFRKADVAVRFPVPARLKPGWNHLAFVYDLTGVRCYVNGELAGRSDDVRPVLERLVRLPCLRFDGFGGGRGFTGDIDEVNYVGAGLGPEEIARLARGEAFR